MTIDPDSDTCDDVGQVACILGVGGAGGAGGAGGNGGAGGAGATCDDFTAEQVCVICPFADDVGDCEAEFAACLVADPGGNVCEKCAVVAIAECF
jgi:hypothetical protein